MKKCIFCVKLNNCASPEKIPVFLAEMNRLKKRYHGRIRILSGAEQDLYSDTDVSGFDYVIASVHYIKLGGEYYSIDSSEHILQMIVEKLDNDFIRLAELYYESVAENVLNHHPDIIGHLDLITKFNENGKLFNENDPRYVQAAQRLIDQVLSCKIPFEVNTGAISRGYRSTPYPAKSLRQYIQESGGKLILSSDAHRKEDLMYGFETLSSLQDDCDYGILDRINEITDTHVLR